MTEASGDTRVFPLGAFFSLLPNLAVGDDDAFDKGLALGTFLTGVPCPVEFEPSPLHPQDVQAYATWKGMVMMFGGKVLWDTLISKDKRLNITDLDAPPDGLSVAEKARFMRRQVKARSIELTHLLMVRRIPADKRKLAAEMYNDPVLRATLFSLSRQMEGDGETVIVFISDDKD